MSTVTETHSTFTNDTIRRSALVLASTILTGVLSIVWHPVASVALAVCAALAIRGSGRDQPRTARLVNLASIAVAGIVLLLLVIGSVLVARMTGSN
jgi:hypothetical protein